MDTILEEKTAYKTDGRAKQKGKTMRSYSDIARKREAEIQELKERIKKLEGDFFLLWTKTGKAGVENKNNRDRSLDENQYHLGKSDAYFDVVAWIERNVPAALHRGE